MLLLQDEVAQFLQNSGVGTIGHAVFVGQLPSSPVDAIAVIASGGNPEPFGPTELHRVNVQVLCRDSKLSEASTTAEKVQSLIAGKWNILPTLKGRITPDHNVGPRYRDTNNNYIFTLNYSIFTVSNTI